MTVLENILRGKRVIIVCGPGGVGKTTCSASLACHYALSGKKVAVLTVDPARRLAVSLGLKKLGNVACRIDLDSVPGIKGGDGEMYAMMLDTKSAMDRLIKRYSTSEEQYNKIIDNSFYAHFAQAVGGTHEYIAMEKLYELVTENDYDVVVLDTPPSTNALDLLQAPQRMMNVLDESVFRWFIKPYLAAGKISVQLLSFGSAYIMKVLTKFVGGEMLGDLAEFISSFQGMFDDFRQRSENLQKLLKHPSTSFLVVATPTSAALTEAFSFHQELERLQLPLGAFIINRATPVDNCSASTPEQLEKALRERGLLPIKTCSGMAERILRNWSSHQGLARRSEKELERFKSRFSEEPILVKVPMLTKDVHDLEGLIDFSRMITGR